MPQVIDAYCTLGNERETDRVVGELLAEMDEAGIDRAVIAPQDREIAILNHQGNNRIIQAARDSDGRLIPACTVNPWLGDEGIDLLRRATDQGARMLVLAPALQGYMLTDELLDPLLERAGAWSVPVYIHTGPHAAAAPTQLVLVAERHRGTRFILAHGGSTDYAWDMPAVLRQAPPNVWFELSFVRPMNLPGWLQIIDSQRLIFGTSWPRNDIGLEVKHFRHYLPMERYPDVYGDNLSMLINRSRP